MIGKPAKASICHLPLRSHDKAVTVLPDGRMEASFNGLTFTVPKQFLAFENGYNDDPNTLLLVDVDPEKIHLSNLCFQYAGFEEVEQILYGARKTDSSAYWQ